MARITKDEVRVMHRNGESPAGCLRAATASGVEYPDATWLVTDALKLKSDEVDEMEENYGG